MCDEKYFEQRNKTFTYCLICKKNTKHAVGIELEFYRNVNSIYTTTPICKQFKEIKGET